MKLRSLVVTAAALAATGTGALALPATAATAAPASSTVTTSAATAQRAAAKTYVHSARKATNQNRTTHDKKRLKKSACLSRYAKAQAAAMASANSMYHQTLAPIQSGCSMGWVGENVAFGFTTGTSVVDDGWMKSTGHRHNLLSRHYSRMGLGAVQSADGTWYVSQVFGRKA